MSSIAIQNATVRLCNSTAFRVQCLLEATMEIALKNFIRDLKIIEKSKPVSTRRHIPTVSDMAEVAGISRAQVYNILNNKTKGPNLDRIQEIMHLFRVAGFEIYINDVFAEYPRPVYSKPDKFVGSQMSGVN